MELRCEKEALLQRLARGSSITSNGAHASQRTRSAFQHRVERFGRCSRGVSKKAQLPPPPSHPVAKKFQIPGLPLASFGRLPRTTLRVFGWQPKFGLTRC